MKVRSIGEVTSGWSVPNFNLAFNARTLPTIWFKYASRWSTRTMSLVICSERSITNCLKASPTSFDETLVRAGVCFEIPIGAMSWGNCGGQSGIEGVRSSLIPPMTVPTCLQQKCAILPLAMSAWNMSKIFTTCLQTFPRSAQKQLHPAHSYARLCRLYLMCQWSKEVTKAWFHGSTFNVTSTIWNVTCLHQCCDCKILHSFVVEKTSFFPNALIPDVAVHFFCKNVNSPVHTSSNLATSLWL